MPGNASRPPVGDAEKGAERWTGGGAKGWAARGTARGVAGRTGGRAEGSTEGRAEGGATKVPSGRKKWAVDVAATVAPVKASEAGKEPVTRAQPWESAAAARAARSACTQAKSARC